MPSVCDRGHFYNKRKLSYDELYFIKTNAADKICCISFVLYILNVSLF